MQEANLPPASEPITTFEETGRSGPSILVWSVIVAVAFVLGLFTGYLLWQQPLQARITSLEKTAVAGATSVAESNANAATSATASANQNQVQVPENVQRYDVPIDDDPILGNVKAPITIIEFSDYQCPYCQKWQAEVLPQITKKYGDKVRLVYRDFPLYGLHAEAENAAMAADCAGEQKRYWEFHDLLFSGQKELGADTYTAYAKSLNMNMDNFKKCLDEQRYQKEVKADYDYASQLGVRSTPTFFINGLAVVGAQPFEVFQQVIDLELAGKIPK
jgi:protein-disulfide isomerase